MLKSNVTPANRIAFWKKLWGTPRLLGAVETDDAFEEFMDAFVPSHMHKMFLKMFGGINSKFSNRFFVDEAVYREWNTKILELVHAGQGKVETTVIYGSPDRLEAYLLKGELRRSLKDIVMDDWQSACAIVRSEHSTLYLFVEPKMRGCVVRSVHSVVADLDPETLI